MLWSWPFRSWQIKSYFTFGVSYNEKVACQVGIANITGIFIITLLIFFSIWKDIIPTVYIRSWRVLKVRIKKLHFHVRYSIYATMLSLSTPAIHTQCLKNILLFGRMHCMFDNSNVISEFCWRCGHDKKAGDTNNIKNFNHL